jgi:hypothetical protein
MASTPMMRPYNRRRPAKYEAGKDKKKRRKQVRSSDKSDLLQSFFKQFFPRTKLINLTWYFRNGPKARKEGRIGQPIGSQQTNAGKDTKSHRNQVVIDQICEHMHTIPHGPSQGRICSIIIAIDGGWWQERDAIIVRRRRHAFHACVL